MNSEETQAPTYELVRPNEGFRFQLGGVTEVGRWAGNDLVIDQDGISRLHARIRVSEAGVKVEDLYSANGTYVNGERISAETELAPGDQLRFDTHSFVLLVQSAHAQVNYDLDALGAQQLPPEWESEEQGATMFIAGDALAALRKQEETAPTAIPAKGHGQGLSSLDCLVGIAGPMTGMVFPLMKQEKLMWEIGRCDTSDIYVNDGTVSRCHAALSFSTSGWRLVSKMPKNGVIVNGQKRLTCQLKSGDVIRLGAVELQFRLAEMTEA